MKLTGVERETIILYNEAEDMATVYTHDRKLIEKLKRLHVKYPDKVYPLQNEHNGAVRYAVPKRTVSVREPYSEERRRADSARAKKAGLVPPGRTAQAK